MPAPDTVNVCPPNASLSVPSDIVNTSFVVEPSTSVAVIVKLPEVAEKDAIPPAVKVTSVPEDELSVTGEDAPEKVRSVEPPPPAACIVTGKDRKSTRLNSSHSAKSRMPSSA